ncbi:MAG: hypothetical protein HQK96_06570 [Nitrospirae bacterium]|nr:hypothetical protein [Nitrospirota bacterium]
MDEIKIDLNDKNTREVVTYLTNQIPVQQLDGSVKLFNNEEIEKILTQKLQYEDHDAVDELIEIAESRDNLDNSQLTKKYSSKSIRVSTPIFARLNQTSQTLNKAYLSHMVGLLAAEHMKVVLNKIANSPDIHVDKVQSGNVENLIGDWEKSLQQSKHLGVEIDLIKQRKDEALLSMKERMEKAQDDLQRAAIKEGTEKYIKKIIGDKDADDDFQNPKDLSNDQLPYWDGDALFYINTPLKPGENKDLYMWFIDKALRRDMKGVSDNALEAFKQKIILPDIKEKDGNDSISMDVHVFPRGIEVSAWSFCHLSHLYCYLRDLGDSNANYGDFGKTVEAMMLDFLPDDMDKIRQGIINRIKRLNYMKDEPSSEPWTELDVEKAFFAYSLEIDILLDIPITISDNMDSIQYEDLLRNEKLPLDTDIVEVLENTLFSELLYKMNKEGFEVLSPEQIKDEYVKEYLNDHGIRQEFEQYTERYKECYEFNKPRWPQKTNSISYYSAMGSLEYIIQNSFGKKDYKRARFFNRYAKDIKMVWELSKYMARSLRTKKSFVITLTMPKFLLYLWEIGKGKQTVNDYVKQLLSDYGDRLQNLLVIGEQAQN